MWESPIKMIIEDVSTRMLDNLDDAALRAVARVAIDVDRDELIKALEYDRGQYDKGFMEGCYGVLNLLSSAWHGKQYYFLEDDGRVYSRESGKCLSVEDAITEFANKIGDDGSI